MLLVVKVVVAHTVQMQNHLELKIKVLMEVEVDFQINIQPRVAEARGLLESLCGVDGFLFGTLCSKFKVGVSY